MSENHDIPPGYDPPSYAPRPRDYRDPAELAEALATLRMSPPTAAAELYRICLDCAYHQGRADAMSEIAGRLRATASSQAPRSERD